ncbi:MAG: hypothetical protein HWD86_06205 [Kangiellaceae bacterium]|nr:hypothetical protein [Kangiellaceae bacterium]
MKFILYILIALSAYAAKAEPDYKSTETKLIIKKMIQAHGGYEKWSKAPSIRFDNVMHNNYHQKEQFAWWIAHEVIDQKMRQVYQDWPMDNATIGFDGKAVWQKNWQKGNPPEFMVHFFYYFVNLPWITQDNNVVLSAVDKFKWPGQEKEFYQIKMTFKGEASVGKSLKDYFVLYIDPDTYLLRGYQYATGYEPFLELMGLKGKYEVFGPLWRTITKYTNVDGLIFPAAFRTMPEADERIVGNHVILNIEIDKPFDYSKAKP